MRVYIATGFCAYQVGRSFGIMSHEDHAFIVKWCELPGALKIYTGESGSKKGVVLLVDGRIVYERTGDVPNLLAYAKKKERL